MLSSHVKIQQMPAPHAAKVSSKIALNNDDGSEKVSRMNERWREVRTGGIYVQIWWRRVRIITLYSHCRSATNMINNGLRLFDKGQDRS